MESLVRMYDPNVESFDRYLAMFLSVIGLFKTNFVTASFFDAPQPITGTATNALTENLIQSMEAIRDGFHSFTSTVNLSTTLIQDPTISQLDYATEFMFAMFAGSLFLQTSMLALVFKYLTQSIVLGVSFLSVTVSFIDMFVIGMIPDIAITTVPLYLNYLRLWDLQYNKV